MTDYRRIEFAEIEDDEIKPVRPKKHGGKIVGRFFIVFGLLILFTLIFIFGCITVVFRGPSETMRDLLAITFMETSAAKFVPRMYFSEEEIQKIIEKNSAVVTDEVTNSEMISIPSVEDVSKIENPIEIFDISSSTFNGKMMIIHDPSRVRLSTAATVFGEETKGLELSELVEKEGAVAGINAGGFADENGVGNGGQPLGIVIKDGQLLSGGEYTCCVIGFDNNDKLIVGNMTASKAAELGLRDAVTFGPVFIVNGKRSEVIGTGGGLNPRTCIGQTADGSVLFLTIDGRQATSLGATHNDCIDILEEYGAVNAANLDGGSSTAMYYNGEVINVSASVYGPRDLPTAFVVLPE